jgi:hypothetical protein
MSKLDIETLINKWLELSKDRKLKKEALRQARELSKKWVLL